MAFANGKIRSFLIANATRPARIYADPDKLNDFVSGLTTESSAPEVLDTVLVDSHRVRRYPGDPGYTRPATNRQRSSLKLKEGTPTTPGKPFFCEVTTGIGPLKETKVTRFTYTGSFITLRRYFEDNAVKAFVLRRESGRSIEFAADPTP